MGTHRLSKANRLFWLGRYVERVLTTTHYIQDVYDRALDGTEFDYRDFCERLDIPCDYTSTWDFVVRYLTDADNPYSIAASMDFAFDNGVVLRETISSEALSYVQMAKNTMDAICASCASGDGDNAAPMLGMQSVIDYLLAFKGTIDEGLADYDSRMIIKVGFSIERIDLILRLGYQTERLDAEFARLDSRLQRSHIQRDGQRLRLIYSLMPNAQSPTNRELLISCIEHLIPDE